MKMLIILITVLFISSAMATGFVVWEDGDDDNSSSTKTGSVNDDNDIIVFNQNENYQDDQHSKTVLDLEGDSSSDSDYAHLGDIPWN